MIIALFAVLLIVIILLILFWPRYRYKVYNYFGNTGMTFKAPPSFTKLSTPESETKLSELSAATIPAKKGSLLDLYIDKLNSVIENNTSTVNQVNIIQIPTFFNSNE